MVLTKLFKPTWGRLAIFIILLAVIALLDQQFLFFTVSPITYNLFGPAAAHFIVFLLIIPYIISCVVPAFFIREWRHAKLHEFVEHHKKKTRVERIEGTVDAIEDYEDIQEKYAGSMRKKAGKSQIKPGTRASGKSKKRKSRPRTKRRR